MTLLEHWQLQREGLQGQLAQQSELSGVLYQVRHALLQTEQNALADCSDDVLRQQAGVLMSCIKQSASMLESPVAAQVWVPQKQERKSSKLWIYALVILALMMIWCAFISEWIISGALLAGMILGLCAWLEDRKASPMPQNETRITIKPDADKLLAVLDAQIRAADRYLNDFSHLNDQLRGASECSDPTAVARAADLLEALYECNEEERAAAEEAARRLLESLGLQALDYSEETSRLFNALPSKNTTRTLCPAILSIKDQHLLRRGTAAVRIDAA